MKFFEVGGIVRDEIMGIPSNDIDYTVVLEETDFRYATDTTTPFEIMEERLERMGFTIFVRTPEHLTIRAKFPPNGNYMTVARDTTGLTADFVLARKEGTYSDGRRPDSVEAGTLEDDLARRDFTVNAIAKDAKGNLIDPFNGQADIAAGIIRAVGNPVDRLTEDSLRAIRALRFSVTKDFRIERGLAFAMESTPVLDAIENLSDDRIRAELDKMFAFDTVASLVAMSEFPALTRAAFAGSVSLTATMKKRK